MSLIRLLKKIVKFAIAELPAKFLKKSLPKETDQEKQLSNNFKEKIKVLELPSTVKLTKQWKQNIEDFKLAVLSKDPRSFLQWDETLPLRACPGVLPQFFNLRLSLCMDSSKISSSSSELAISFVNSSMASSKSGSISL